MFANIPALFSQNIYPVANYNASGSTVTATCSGVAGSDSLTNCIVTAAGGSDFKAGEGVRIEDDTQLSFASAATIDIEFNTFNIADDYQAPYTILSGAYTTGTIANNTINYSGVYPNAPVVIAAAAGTISSNVITVSQNAQLSPAPSSAFCLQPSTTNASSPKAGEIPISVSNNTVKGTAVKFDVEVADPGFSTPPITCSGNAFSSAAQYPVYNDNPNNTDVSCTQ